jgi:hypothetical protein
MPKPKPKIEEITKQFGEKHSAKDKAEKEMKKLRQQFFDLIEIPEPELAQQTIYAETDDPAQYVAILYPKWKIVSKWERKDGEWKLIIQEDPTKKNHIFVNPLDKQVYTRTVVEGAPDVDLERMKEEDPELYERLTFEPPPPPRELFPLSSMDDEEKAGLRKYLTPGKLTNRMEAPRKAKPEELEGLSEPDDSDV